MWRARNWREAGGRLTSFNTCEVCKANSSLITASRAKLTEFGLPQLVLVQARHTVAVRLHLDCSSRYRYVAGAAACLY